MFYLCIRLITKHMDEITKIETVDQYDQLFGLETLHPLVNVIDFSKATKSVVYSAHLSRCHTDNRSFLIIVILTSVCEIPAFGIFQEQTIESDVHTDILNRLGSF